MPHTIRLNCISFAFGLLYCTSTVFLCFWMFKWCFSLNMDPSVWLWWSVYVFVSVVRVVWSVCIDLSLFQNSCIIVFKCFSPFSSFKHLLCVWLHVSLCSKGFVMINNTKYSIRYTLLDQIVCVSLSLMWCFHLSWICPVRYCLVKACLCRFVLWTDPC